MNKTQIAVLRCSEYSRAEHAIREIFSLHGGIGKFFARGDRVLIKPNLLAAPERPDEPVVTEAAFILAAAHILASEGCHISVGDSPGFGTVRSILNKIGIVEELERIGLSIVEFTRPERFFSGQSIDRSVLEADKILNLPKLKVHCQMLLTLGTKNLFGCITGKRKPYLHMTHGDKANVFAEMLVRNSIRIAPTFTLLDGIESMEKRGPRAGFCAQTGVVAGGPDPIALDRIVCDMLGVPPDDYRILRAARDLNLGTWQREKIEILGVSELPRIKLQFSRSIPISFAPHRVLKSTITNMILKRTNRRAPAPKY